MSLLPHLSVFLFFAVLHLLLFSICPASGRIYRTNDAVVIEVDDIIVKPAASAFKPPPISTMYAVNPVNPYTGLSYLQQPNFPFWPYNLYQPTSSSLVSGDAKKVAATSPQSTKQQDIPCGVGPKRSTPVVRVTGGTDVTSKNPWPFMVGLKMSSDDSTFCGGTLLSATRILTAARCVNRLPVFSISQLTVSFGMINQIGSADAAQQVRRVTRVAYHLDYNDKTNQNDIAVLTINPPITLSSAISPVCLPSRSSIIADQFAGQTATILGWGRSSPTDTKNPLQQATVKVIANADCNASYQTAKTTITNKQFCTATGGASACQFDTGGPLVTKDPKTSTWTLAGVYSFGNGCANPATPSVYTSVAYFRSWIITYMNT